MVGRKRRGIRARLAQLGLPLLARELSDQAGRGRLYIVRTMCAAILFVLGYLYLRDLLAQISGDGALPGLESLGKGGALFDRVWNYEAAGILLFLPALSCGAIAGEKERNTLSVLLTTRLGAATIVLEKLLSRLVLAFSLLLLSVPLLAVGYAMGGIAIDYMIANIVMLVALCTLVAAMSLACSAWCGGTVSAFFMSYAVGIALTIVAAVVAFPVAAALTLTALRFNLPAQVFNILMGALMMFMAALVFYFLAVLCLVGRAFVTPRNFVMALFQALDSLYTHMNVLVGNIVLTREKNSLPDDKPIAWRETAKKSLGTVRYLVRILVVIEFPTLFLLVSAAETRAFATSRTLTTGLWNVAWCITAALLAVKCGSIVSGERTRQTLPLLLATPIPGEEVVRQLFAGVRRLINVLLIPFATIAVFEYWFFLHAILPGEAILRERLLCDVLEMAIYPPLVAWGAFYLGAKIRSPLWAMIGSLMAVAGITLIPFYSEWLFRMCGIGAYWPPYASLASPAAIILLNEARRATGPAIAVNFLIYGALLFVIRRHCLRHADRLLGRAEIARRVPPAPVPAAMREDLVTAEVAYPE